MPRAPRFLLSAIICAALEFLTFQMTTPRSQSDLELRLFDRIAEHGPLTFAEFMEAALYDRDHGYYPARRREAGSTPVGTDGDYFTSPSTHPAFGALLAVQLHQMWELLGSPAEFVVTEMGAGDGVLASDITEYAERQFPEFAEAMRYSGTDLAPVSGSTLVGEPGVSGELALKAVGCVISNELLDAHPVNRFEIQDGAVREVFVGISEENGEFTDILGDVSDPEITKRISPFLNSLSEGYRGEINLQLDSWAGQVATTLERGFVITIDYGFERSELYASHRTEGSLRSYYQHTLGQNPLRRIGKQDLTAHVDFTAVDEALAAAGISRIGNVTQSEFLLGLGLDNFLNDVSDRAARRELSRIESEEDLAGIGALIDPEGLGSFRVAVQSKGVEIDGEQLYGLSHPRVSQSQSQPKRSPATYPAPLLQQATATHARLLRSANPFGQSQAQLQATQMPTWEELFSDEP